MFKENIKSLVIIVLCLMLTAGVVMAYSGNADIVVEGDLLYSEAPGELGGITTDREYFNDSFVDSGMTLELALSATATLTPDQICQYKNLENTPGATAPAYTIHLPTSAKLIRYCLQTKNDTYKMYYSNESTVAATTTTFAISAGDDMELLEADGSDVVIPGAEDAILEFRNAGSNVVKTTVTSVRAAD